MCAVRSGRDGRRQTQKAQSRRLRQETLVRSRRYNNSGVLCAVRSGRDGRRQTQKPSFAVAGTTTVEYSAQHAPDGMVDVVCQKKIIGNVVPSGATVTTFHPPPTHASPPSDASRGSRKRVRRSENTCTYSKRVVARQSTGGAVTMPDIDGQTFPVRRDYSVKTEVQLFF